MAAGEPSVVEDEVRQEISLTSDSKHRKSGKLKRVLHFSDGVLEEYSSEEDDACDSVVAQQVEAINPSNLTWGPWFWYYGTYLGVKTLNVCDYLGESLANFFGITTPKYQYEIDEYHRSIEEAKKEKETMDLEMGGWTESTSTTSLEMLRRKQPSEFANDLGPQTSNQEQSAEETWSLLENSKNLEMPHLSTERTAALFKETIFQLVYSYNKKKLLLQNHTSEN